jgi:hypothetical protein
MQVIAFPNRRSEPAPARAAAVLHAACVLTYIVGFFLALPMLAMFAFAFAFTAQAVAALACVAGLAGVAALTRAAYARL